MRIGDSVVIRAPQYARPLRGLDLAFEKRTGVVIAEEMDGRTRMYRVRLDEPVEIGGVGTVYDDLWSGKYLRRRRG